TAKRASLPAARARPDPTAVRPTDRLRRLAAAARREAAEGARGRRGSGGGQTAGPPNPLRGLPPPQSGTRVGHLQRPAPASHGAGAATAAATARGQRFLQ